MSRVGVELRGATVADAPALAGVHVRAWREGYAGLVDPALIAAATVARRERQWARWLGTAPPWPIVTVVAVAAGGALAGFCSVATPARDLDDPRTAEIAALYVDPPRWGEGVGSALLAAALDGLRAERWPAVTLWVIEGNARAERVYVRAGFRPDGARRRDLGVAPPGVELPWQRRLRVDL